MDTRPLQRVDQLRARSLGGSRGRHPIARPRGRSATTVIVSGLARQAFRRAIIVYQDRVPAGRYLPPSSAVKKANSVETANVLGLKVPLHANIREAKATAHHARSSLRHGYQLDDVAVVVLVIEATAAIPIVELSVFKAPGPASEGEPSVLDSLQDRVEFGATYVKRIMLACDSPLRVSEVHRQCVVDAHRRKVTA